MTVDLMKQKGWVHWWVCMLVCQWLSCILTQFDWLADWWVGWLTCCCICSPSLSQDDAACQSWLQRHIATTDSSSRIIPLPSARESEVILTEIIPCQGSPIRLNVHTFYVSDHIFMTDVLFLYLAVALVIMKIIMIDVM